LGHPDFYSLHSFTTLPEKEKEFHMHRDAELLVSIGGIVKRKVEDLIVGYFTDGV
jgi:hypothetical protein